jgi:arabinogalactan endo-1,4-beta-galactosidase
MKRIKYFLATALLCLTTAVQAQKYVGGDLSMLLKYEEQNATYLDKDGKEIADVLAFVKEQGWNTVRVRLFVDPSKDTDKNVCQDLEYVQKLGKRIKDAGLNFLLDFHYSDTWADPEHQAMPQIFDMVNTPAFEYIYYYTKESLEALVKAGATPDFIQTGNEVSFGMLWDVCKIGPKSDNDWSDYSDGQWEHLAKAFKNAGRACREVCPKAKIIIHTEQCANNPTLDVAFFKRIKQHEIDYDIIGTSYYPYFKGEISKLDNGLSELEKNFPDKAIQIVETGYPSKWEVQGTTFDYTKNYPYSHEGQRKYTADLITMLKKHKQVNGLNWWYAEANAKGCTGDLKEGWYNASLFDNETGKALPALYELKEFNDGTTAISSAISQERKEAWYTLDGRKLEGKPSHKGLYIMNQKKVIVK